MRVFDLVEGERKRLEDEGELEEGDDLLDGVFDLVEGEREILQGEGELEDGDDLLEGVFDLVEGEMLEGEWEREEELIKT